MSDHCTSAVYWFRIRCSSRELVAAALSKWLILLCPVAGGRHSEITVAPRHRVMPSQQSPLLLTGLAVALCGGLHGVPVRRLR